MRDLECFVVRMAKVMQNRYSRSGCPSFLLIVTVQSLIVKQKIETVCRYSCSGYDPLLGTNAREKGKRNNQSEGYNFQSTLPISSLSPSSFPSQTARSLP